jgi:hypothetical protein
MKQINNLTNDPKQEFQVFTEDGTTLYITLYYYITQKSWFYDFTYGDYTCQGSRVVLTPNSIRHLKNILPFGIAFLTDSKAEPYSLDDFSSGRIKMYILNQDEVREIESTIYYD